MNSPISIFWFRRDLRLHDNVALYQALTSPNPVLPIFIFDTNILEQLDDKADARVSFIYQTLQQIKIELEKIGSTLLIYYGVPMKVWQQILQDYTISAVFANHDYEPYATERDHAVAHLLQQYNVPFQTYKDQCIFEKNEILSSIGKPYTVFTPYSRQWKQRYAAELAKPYQTHIYFSNFLQTNPAPRITLQRIGFEEVTLPIPPIDFDTLSTYHQTRNLPAIQGTSRLGVHLRFGTISIREVVAQAVKINETFLNELIWREFFMQILWHFPALGRGASFKPTYENIKWRNNEDEFERWCEGKTGYPIVDAGMRELNATGFMHNRVRMITASFLVKHLLIDWRWGEAYFAKKLLDFDLAANNGNWQWVAGCGTDAAPYFRIFNPTTQADKFDPQQAYIRKWIPEFGTENYIQPIVEHNFARNRCLEVYKEALSTI